MYQGKGSHHNFTMFFQLELVKIAQSPHAPSAILIEKTKSRGTVNGGALH